MVMYEQLLSSSLYNSRSSDQRFQMPNFRQTGLITNARIKSQERPALLLSAVMCALPFLPYGEASEMVHVAVSLIEVSCRISDLQPTIQEDGTRNIR
jgi:hypothetical protein